MHGKYKGRRLYTLFLIISDGKGEGLFLLLINSLIWIGSMSVFSAFLKKEKRGPAGEKTSAKNRTVFRRRGVGNGRKGAGTRIAQQHREWD